VRRGLVLVLAPPRLCARRSANRPVCYQLRGVSPRDEHGGADLIPGVRRRLRLRDLATEMTLCLDAPNAYFSTIHKKVF